MRFLPQAVLACAALAAISVAAIPQPAIGGQPQILTLQLGNGQLVQVQYTNDVAPLVVQRAVPIFAMAPDPAFAAPAFAAPAFAALERISALMDRQADLMMRQAVQLSTMPFATMQPANLPQGASFYSYSFSSNGSCTQTTQISYSGQGLKPRTISSTSGNCGGASTAPAYHLEPGGGARTIEASSRDAYKAMVRPAVQYQRN